MRQNLYLEETFDNTVGNWAEVNVWDADNDIKVTTQEALQGKSLRVRLIKGSRPNNQRSELGTEPTQAPGEGWWGFAIFLPQSFEFEPSFRVESLVQWQSFPDQNLGENFRSAPLFIGLEQGNFIVEQRTDPNPNSNSSSIEAVRTTIGAATKGVWHKFVVHAKWSYTNTGQLTIWKDDVKVLEKLNLPNCYNDVLHPYIKFGIYKWDFTDSSIAQTERIVYYDEIRGGTALATYNDVYPLKKLIRTKRYYHDGSWDQVFPS